MNSAARLPAAVSARRPRRTRMRLKPGCRLSIAARIAASCCGVRGRGSPAVPPRVMKRLVLSCPPARGGIGAEATPDEDAAEAGLQVDDRRPHCSELLRGQGPRLAGGGAAGDEEVGVELSAEPLERMRRHALRSAAFSSKDATNVSQPSEEMAAD